MPELPEVETVVRTLQARVAGARVTGVLLARPDILTPPGFGLVERLVGRSFRAVTRRAKRILFHLDDGNRFYIHLGMTGQLTTQPAAAPRLPHTHLVLQLEACELRFRDPRRFGGIWWVGTGAVDDKLGPEPLTLKPRQLAKRLAGTRRAIKAALLDQAVVAGLGNIYVDESLFAARIHPLEPASTLSPEQVGRLNRAVKSTLRRAIRYRGSTLRDYVDGDGAAGDFQRRHRVYDRAGEACLTCKSMIERMVVGGRSTHFCPRCQPRG